VAERIVAMPTIRLVTEVPGPASRALAARREAAGARGAAKLTDVAVVRAHGAAVTDADGNVLLDFAGGIGALAVGHTPERVVAAVQAQAAELLHLCAIVGSYESYVALLERLVAIAPGEHAKKAVLLNSGAEAVETAVKIARAATGRQAVLVFEGAYHGRTNLTLAMTSKYGLFKQGFGPFAPEVYRVPFPNVYRRPTGMTEEAFVRDAIERFDTALVAQVDPRALAAVVIEPVQGEGGFVPVPPAFLRRLREVCSEHGVVLVADEVQSGMGRTGRLWAVEHAGVVPDLLVTAKSVASGMPIAAVVGRSELMDAPHPGGLGGTYSGNPLACAAALETIDAITAPGFLERARAIGERMRAALARIADRTPAVGDVRGLGPMLALEFVRDRTSRTPDPDLVARVTGEALRRGLIVIRAGLYSNCLRLLPPLTLSDDELDEGMAVLAEAVAAAGEVEGDGGRLPARPEAATAGR
jgi:4-aminobutyrate aminotransferase / (S)-3-amino-2-methylpropionate transaminase / 5-aminovalerate transaminase